MVRPCVQPQVKKSDEKQVVKLFDLWQRRRKEAGHLEFPVIAFGDENPVDDMLEIYNLPDAFLDDELPGSGISFTRR
jgi:hypothetical protein